MCEWPNLKMKRLPSTIYKAVTALVLALCVFNSPAIANYSFTNLEESEWTQETRYLDKTLAKLGFGLKNAGLGWLDLIREPYNEANTGLGGWVGLAKGVFFTVTNSVGGALHAATFLIPIDVQLPKGGVQIDLN